MPAPCIVLLVITEKGVHLSSDYILSCSGDYTAFHFHTENVLTALYEYTTGVYFANKVIPVRIN
jgi:hypothetical protein